MEPEHQKEPSDAPGKGPFGKESQGASVKATDARTPEGWYRWWREPGFKGRAPCINDCMIAF